MENQQQQEFNWPALESNPEVFTNYMHSIGMSDQWAIGEVFGFDEDLLAFLPQPVIAVIVAIQRNKDNLEEDKSNEADSTLVPYYMKQSKVLDNACGIIACLHSVLNKDQVQITEGSTLAKFKADAMAGTPQERCSKLEGFEEF